MVNRSFRPLSNLGMYVVRSLPGIPTGQVSYPYIIFGCDRIPTLWKKKLKGYKHIILQCYLAGYCGCIWCTLYLKQIPSVSCVRSYCTGPTRRKRKLTDLVTCLWGMPNVQ